jgi:hypothetical protein
MGTILIIILLVLLFGGKAVITGTAGMADLRSAAF